MTSQWLKNILRHQVELIFIFHIRSCLTKIGKKSPITILVVFFSLQEMEYFEQFLDKGKFLLFIKF